MTPEEAREELFRINTEYMKNTPKKRLKLYWKYIKSREEVRDALKQFLEEKRNNTK